MSSMLNDIHTGLAACLASFDIPDQRVAELSAAIQRDGLSLKRFDICTHGICIDYFTTDRAQLAKLVNDLDSQIRGIDIFPWGIPVIDLYQAHVRIAVPELAGQIANR